METRNKKTEKSGRTNTKTNAGNDPHRYDDILHLPHHVSRKHPQMAMIDRAAQFSPFAALTGYDAAIRETGRLTERFVELEESDREVLDQRLQLIKSRLGEHPTVSITYFQPDAKKEGGSYLCVRGPIKKIDEYRRTVTMMDGTEVPFSYIAQIESQLFEEEM